MDEETKNSGDNPLNAAVIAGVAFMVGAAMSIYFTLSNDLGFSSLMMMLACTGIISFTAWRLVKFIKQAGPGSEPK